MGDYGLILLLSITCLATLIPIYLLSVGKLKTYAPFSVLGLFIYSIVFKQMEIANDVGGQSLGPIVLWIVVLSFHILINISLIIYLLIKKQKANNKS